MHVSLDNLRIINTTKVLMDYLKQLKSQNESKNELLDQNSKDQQSRERDLES
jgi:hypothetical protein